MDFLLLIVEPRGQRAQRNEAQGRDAYAQMLDFAETLKQQGVLQAAQSLLGDERGTRVQRR